MQYTSKIKNTKIHILLFVSTDSLQRHYFIVCILGSDPHLPGNDLCFAICFRPVICIEIINIFAPLFLGKGAGNLWLKVAFTDDLKLLVDWRQNMQARK